MLRYDSWLSMYDIPFYLFFFFLFFLVWIMVIIFYVEQDINIDIRLES